MSNWHNWRLIRCQDKKPCWIDSEGGAKDKQDGTIHYFCGPNPNSIAWSPAVLRLSK